MTRGPRRAAPADNCGRERARGGAGAVAPPPRPTRSRRPSGPSHTRAPARRRRSRTSASAPSIAGHSDTRRRLEVVDAQRAARQPARQLSPRAPRAREREPRAGRPRAYTSAVESAGSERHDRRTRAAPAALSGSTMLAGAGPERAAPARAGSARRRRARPRAPQRRRPRTGASRAAQPQHRRRVRRAAAHPGRDRDPLADLDPRPAGRPSPRARKRRERAGDEVRALDARRRRPRPVAETASARARRPARPTRSRVTSSWRPSSRMGPRNRHRLTLPGASSLTHRVSLRASSRNSPGREALGALVGRVAQLDERRPRPLADVGAAPGASASEPASVLRRCAKASWTSARSGGVRAADPRRRRPSEHRVDVRHRPEHGPRDRPQHLDLARELREHRRRAVGRGSRRRGEPLADLALHHHDPAPTLGSSSIVRRITVAATPYGRLATTFVGGGSSAARSSSSASAMCSVTLSNGASVSRAAPRGRGRSRPRARCADPRREPLGQDPLAAADLEHDVAAASSASRSITSRMLRSTRKF